VSAWAGRFANLDAIKFCAAVEGDCWSFMDGMPNPVRFERGDVLVMNGAASNLSQQSAHASGGT
jgi:hypothetical protein